MIWCLFRLSDVRKYYLLYIELAVMGQFIVTYIATKLDAVFFDRHHAINNFVSQMLHCWWVGSVALAIKTFLSWAKDDTFACIV